MNRYILLLAIVLISSSYQATEPNLIIGSFNIQTLGPTKMSRPEFVETVCRILSKYDIIAIQEIRDSSTNMAVINTLVSKLNEYVLSKGINYNFVISPRLGQGTHKEIYAYVYRTKTNGSLRKIQVVKQMVHDDIEMVYDRPPFIAEFKVLDTSLSIKEFTLMNLHLRPTAVFIESLGLRKVVDRYRAGSVKNIAILGDFNIDCSYISTSDRQSVALTLNDFTWYIRDRYATTISTSNCAYDRILVNTAVFKNAIVTNSNMTYRYDLEFGMNMTEVSKISDHYPVEIKLF
ncbi:unnamed protein product [Brachionus calyciflorus]|uniref:Deoxyribonuclease n=1 Tax=Brachionus calyciflorus TaxID=104777 RepID=A0A813T5L8_9BILA|nr:unnamed protein product [Brachionus calyciflorus]